MPALRSVAVPLLIGALGFFAMRFRLLSPIAIGTLSVLALDITLPCQIAAKFLTSFDPSSLAALWRLPLWWLGFTVVSTLPTALSAPLFSHANRREAMVCLFYPNAIFVPLAIITERFGPESPLPAELFLMTMIFPAFFFNTAPIWFNATRPRSLRRLFTPVLVATVLGLSLAGLGFQNYVPRFVTASLTNVGAAAVPTLLIMLGGSIYLDYARHGVWPWRDMICFVAVKNILFPAMALLILAWLRPGYNVALLLLLMAAAPPVTALPIITDREGGNRESVNALMVASFLASAITLPLAMVAFEHVFGP